MKPYSQRGKKFDIKPIKIWAGVDDNLLSYEEMNEINDFWIKDGKMRRGFSNYERNPEFKITMYIPKKTRNKKDIVAAHKRSGKKTERQQAKQEIQNILNDENN